MIENNVCLIQSVSKQTKYKLKKSHSKDFFEFPWFL